MFKAMSPVYKPPVAVFEEIKWEITESRISTVISMLPASLQSRINPFRSLRRSSSLYNLRTNDIVDEPSPSSVSSGTSTPCPPRRRVRPLSDTDALALTKGRVVTEDPDGITVDELTVRPPPLPRRQDGASGRAASGIHWKFARQGAGLVNVSMDGYQYSMDDENSAFERKAYMDGLTYLLKGLPQDLNTREVDQLRSALPQTLNQGEYTASAGHSKPGHSRTMLHRTVQTVVVNVVLLLHMLLPYLLLCVNYAAKMERKYKVSERLVGHGMELATTVGRSGAILTERMCNLNDGRVGRALSDILIWTIDGITRGISDGVREGLVIVET
ncbi:hypothetical protein B0I35DRAFT_506725 [Stachybotrys elegans]|uniref:Uncharacterized protein n=1 Tax=Stachybotrys elegans TaxID=80388 RepID=A0A8K0T6W1_9HYPO|nr:hypothetical protein B0I35DRAFT_506725 [Stachybotrys elegans]